MNHDDLQGQLADYALGLLAAPQEELMTRHLATCVSCRQALQGERRVGMLVTQTLNAAVQGDAPHLYALRPEWRPASTRSATLPKWTAQLVPLTAVALLLVFSFLLRPPRSDTILPGMGLHTATVTMTHTPTATLAQGSTATNEPTPAVRQTVVHTSRAPQPQPTPSAAPAPVATGFLIHAN